MTITDDVKTQQIAMQSDSRKGEFCSDANIFNTVFWSVFVTPQMLRMYMYCVSVKFKHLTDLQ